MKFATIRDFRTNVSKVMQKAEKEEIIVTKRGRPFALLVPISEEDLEEVRKAIKTAKLRSALEDLWDEARKKGKDKITMEEINAEIKSARSEKYSKSSS